MKRIYIPVVFILILFGIFAMLQMRPQQTIPNATIDPAVPTETPQVSELPAQTIALQNDVRNDLLTKYKKPADEIIITVETQTEKHAKGLVQYKSESGGAVWYAVKEENWQVVYDGRNTLSCSLAEEYFFPETMVGTCLK